MVYFTVPTLYFVSSVGNLSNRIFLFTVFDLNIVYNSEVEYKKTLCLSFLSWEGYTFLGVCAKSEYVQEIPGIRVNKVISGEER